MRASWITVIGLTLLQACSSDDGMADMGVDARVDMRLPDAMADTAADAIADAEVDLCATAPECSPGETVRTNAGCLLGQSRILTCGEDCAFVEGICAAELCTPEEATEELDCGLCGQQTRTCTDGSWRYGECVSMGMCVPGEVETRTCGMCGETRSICSDACVWEDEGECTGEGECAPGATVPAEMDACAEGERGVRECSAMCAYGEPVCAPLPPLDVILLFDVTGSIGNALSGAHDGIIEAAGALFDAGGIDVGVAVYADFPQSPYGSEGDIPFEGRLAPTSDRAAFAAAIRDLPRRRGGDVDESGVEALHILSGGTAHPPSIPIACADGEAGGCWRADATRAVILVTDAPHHNGPNADGGLRSPYSGIEPAPAQWDAVAAQMLAQSVRFYPVVARGTIGPAAVAQHQRMLMDLGQPDEDGVVIDRASMIPGGLRDIIPRVLAVR